MNANASSIKRGTLAVLALIFGIAGIVISWIPIINFLGFALSVAAIVMGAIELSKINKGKSSVSGKGFAITGIVLGIIAIIIGIVFSVILTTVLGGLFGTFGG